MVPMHVNADRLWASIAAMAKIGATELGGCNRQALTDLDKQGRDLFVSWVRAIGCDVRVDAVGNIFARRAGSDPDAEPVLTGSHLDTQPTGGRFDGVYGVLAGLEVLRTLEDQGVTTRHPIEVAVWTNEEGCRFAPAMLGSGVVAGEYDLEFAYSRTDKDGLSFGDELKRIGYCGDAPAQPRAYKAIFEAHIEQGPVLERERTTIGAVTGIQGLYWLDITLTGSPAHAGPTPMEMRRDPWRAAAPIISGLFDIAKANAPDGRATIGDGRVEPGSRNTIPQTIVLSVDIRHPDAATLDRMLTDLNALVFRHAEAADVEARMDQVWYMPPTRFDQALVARVEAAANDLGYGVRRIVSGAGHDSLNTARFAPTVMIFVPCLGGISHNEAEDASLADIEAGANVLLNVVADAAVIDT
jgi:N-carbamoyl-L-amino-acid hydrolase